MRVWLGFFAICVIVRSAVAETIFFNTKRGFRCPYIEQLEDGDNSKASVRLYLESVESENKENLLELKIPVLILKLEDMRNFTNLPYIPFYEKKYRSYRYGNIKRSHYFERFVDYTENTFELYTADEDEYLDKEKAFNGYVMFDERNSRGDQSEVVFPIHESGIYCILIAPPIGTKVTSFVMPVEIRNSYGYLSFDEYRVYLNLQYATVLGLVIAVCLSFNMTRFVKEKRGALSSTLPSITRLTVLYILTPFICILLLRTTLYYMKNTYPSYNDFRNSRNPYFIIETISKCCEISRSFFLLLFLMGYGSIYSNPSTSYRKMPTSMMNTAIFMLIVNIGLFCTTQYITYYLKGYQIGTGSGTRSIDPKLLSVGIHSYSFVILKSVEFAWLIADIVSYFVTLYNISKLMPTLSKPTGVTIKETIHTCLRRTMLMMLSFSHLLSLLSSVIWFLQTMTVRFITTLAYLSDEKDKTFSERIILRSHSTKFEYLSKELHDIWTMSLSVFLVSISLYFFWIRHDDVLKAL